MKTIAAAAVVVGCWCVVGWIFWRRWRRRSQIDQDVSPRWLNENTYDQDGDDSWQ